MSSIQATRLRKGMLIKFENDLYRIDDTHHLTPGNKRGYMLVKMRSLRANRLLDHKFRAEEDVERAVLDEQEMQYLYREGDSFHFMNTSTFEQLHINLDVLGEDALYLLPDAIINIEFFESQPVGIHLPPTVDLAVREAAPGIKGATASAQIKPATLETGLVVNVPAFVNAGDRIRVNTETGEYLSRV